MTDQHRSAYQLAMRSYNAMETTKRRHFDYLTLIETRKKKFNLDATPAQTQMLQALLRDHDEEVRTFKACCDDLKAADAAAHAALFAYLAEINKAMAPIHNGH
jgi:hypothetical protein